jgi:bifunctional N-acetylglucosamine-1-phosphate-uridyltransferase/glucosamine-1-phosphate-acetyltransferase GlmU-like protein
MIIIIMAGGLGKRMESDIPKVLHNVTDPNNKITSYPMLIHVIFTATKLNPTKIFIIVGKFRDIIISTINKYIDINTNIIEFIDQEQSLGTGHAIHCCLDKLKDYNKENAIILSGDVPLISLDILKKLQGDNKILITELDNPFGCGRIIIKDSKIIGIREEKDCNEEEKKIKLINCGIYQIKITNLLNFIPQINNNNKSNEYYLTDIIELIINNNLIIEPVILEKNLQWQIKNVNTKKDLLELNHFINYDLNI